MPKLKTNRGAAKRFTQTASGRFKHRSAYRNHILTKKSTKQKRHLRHPVYLSPSNVLEAKRLLPYA